MKNTENELDKKRFGYNPSRVSELYANHPELTLAELSDITGWTVEQLKRILAGGSR